MSKLRFHGFVYIGAGHEPSFVSYESHQNPVLPRFKRSLRYLLPVSTLLSRFVGEGMLDAAVSGTIFASPSPSQIYAALKDLDARARKRMPCGQAGGHSAIMILMNYTGENGLRKPLGA